MTPLRRDRTLILCTNPRCHDVAAVLLREAGELVLEIQHRHHGERHTSRLTLTDLARMLDSDEAPSSQGAG